MCFTCRWLYICFAIGYAGVNHAVLSDWMECNHRWSCGSASRVTAVFRGVSVVLDAETQFGQFEGDLTL